VVIKLAVILFFLVVGFGHVNPANWSPFLPFGAGGILRGASIIFFAYIGFDQISTSAEEARNPSKDLPIGIIASLLICTVLYILVTAVLTGVVSYTKLDVPSPVSHALILLGLNAAGSIISIGAIWYVPPVLILIAFFLWLPARHGRGVLVIPSCKRLIARGYQSLIRLSRSADVWSQQSLHLVVDEIDDTVSPVCRGSLRGTIVWGAWVLVIIAAGCYKQQGTEQQ